MLSTATQRRRLASVLLPALFVVLLLAACGGGAGKAPVGDAPVESIENPSVGIAIEGASAAGFEQVANDGAILRFRRPAKGGELEATVEYGAGEPQVAGVNLFEAMNNQEAEIEARPGGNFFGQGKLGTQLGDAYSTRGRYEGEAGEEVEEIRIFAVHPAGDRLLWLTYRYKPMPGTAEARTKQAMAAFGLIAPLASAAPVDEASPGE